MAACVLTTAGIIIRAIHFSLTGAATTAPSPAVWIACGILIGASASVPVPDIISLMNTTEILRQDDFPWITAGYKFYQ